MTTAEFLTSEVPDPEGSRRFLEQLAEIHPSHFTTLSSDAALLSDVLTLVSFSPLFAATLLHDPGHITWLRRERMDTRVRDKNTLLESLGRFALTHSSLAPNVMLARFRRRELMRIFLRDARRLSTVAEITEEISNLADAILEYALRLSKQELDNRFGAPQEEGERGRLRPAEFCIVSLGKLGSLELNYSSDIDLLFVFSNNGVTSGSGAKAATTNLEYFSKLTQAIIKLVGGHGGEGAAYRVDMRLRPHGRIGPLALTLRDSVRYYETEAAPWERQVLIRSRFSAGSDKLFRRFFRAIEDVVFSTDISLNTALANVAQSKQKIDRKNVESKGTDIKLGAGGIREIEFIAQSLQLAYGGRDKWLRVPHTLVSLDRLAQRGHLTKNELAELYSAYDFFRHLEHILQIENGLQTHLVPYDGVKRASIARRCGLDPSVFESTLESHRRDVHSIFIRVFEKNRKQTLPRADTGPVGLQPEPFEKIKEKLKECAPKFLEIVNAHPEILKSIADPHGPYPDRNYSTCLNAAVSAAQDFGGALSALRRSWYRLLLEIVVFDVFGRSELAECKRLQTRLAEASIDAALAIAKNEAARRWGVFDEDAPLAILALGKLGSGGLDYFSDLDLVFVHGDIPSVRYERPTGNAAEFYSRVVEVFSTVLSSITRDGYLYRVDLRLRPHGSDGPLVISKRAITEYFNQEADIWELLAYVNLRAVGGDIAFAQTVENEIRRSINERASKIDPQILEYETREVREKLERQRASRRFNEIDFKYGTGGLLDVYFAVRFLQLRHRLFDNSEEWSTDALLSRMIEMPSLSSIREPLVSLTKSYRTLSVLDHELRLFGGRTSKIGIASPVLDDLFLHEPGKKELEPKEILVASLLEAREAFDRILSQSHP